ncbi:MAG: galactose-1-phosphate uridylyltransferase [Silvanigrellales bacterium]|jgi:UDPglucose--hexose-1-phosphate uridylyltransferase|nr:galactose-1-phosphate uridylyltransferase [Silvanigrellales bacterium]
MRLFKFESRKADGRAFIQYSKDSFPVDFGFLSEGLTRPADWEPPALRYNAMRDEYVAISTSRNSRPFLPPKEYCPLCPARDSAFPTEIPETGRLYEWAVFENMYPALAPRPDGIGKCEVVLYSPHHDSTLAMEPLEHILGLMHVWRDRSKSLGALPFIRQVFIFENKGAEVGVTLHHPHGQIYAFREPPPFLAREHAAARAHFQTNGRCLVCDLAQNELETSSRVVLETPSLVAFVPYAARYPYEVHVTTKAHRPLFEALEDNELSELALLLKRLLFKYDALFGISLPYIMAHHQAESTEPGDRTYHWHLEFYPPHRTRDKLKFLAGVESGTGFFVNDTSPEGKAAELRAIAVPF